MTAPQPIATLPIDLYHNRVYVPVEINGHQFSMVLDSGAALSGLSQAAAQTLQVKIAGKAQLAGNGESRVPISLAKDVTFRLGGTELVEKSVAIIPLQDLEAHEGRPIAGIVGVGLFRRYVVVTDYAARTLALYDPESFAYTGAGQIVPLHGNAALFHARISIPGHDPIPTVLSVDYGTYSALRLYRPFVEKHQLLALLTTTVDSFGFGIGGEFPEKLGRVTLLEIGPLKLNGPVTSFSEAKGGATASGGETDGTIGGAVLSRFKVILDYSRQRMILEPQTDPATPFSADASGLLLQAGGSDLRIVSIRHVLANTPAAAAGFREADTILSLNGQDAQNLGLEGIRILFCQTGVYHLQLRRRQQNLEMDMSVKKGIY